MVDSTKKPTDHQSVSERNHLLSRIDELEKLLAKKKAEAQEAAQDHQTPKLKVGTDGIPVLVDAVAEDNLNTGDTSMPPLNKDDAIINDIIDKIDKEITQDLDELIVMLKDSIIDEVKTRLLEELHLKKK